VGGTESVRMLKLVGRERHGGPRTQWVGRRWGELTGRR